MSIDLRVTKKNGWQILDYSNKRKIVRARDNTKSWSNRKDAEKARDALIAAVATKKVILSDRHKFKEEYLKYASMRLEQGDTEGTRLTKASTRGYLSNYKNYISDCFPDIYVDEVSGPVLEEFIKKVKLLKDNSFTGKSMWFKCKDLVYKIKTFLRYAAGQDIQINEKALHWHLKDQHHLHPEDDAKFYAKKTPIIQPTQAAKLINGLYANRHDSHIALLKLTAIASFTYLGLRYSEMKGIKKADVNLANQTIWIGGSWSTAENRYVKRTKKQDSTRFVEIQNDYLPYIIEWMDKIKDLDNPYLFPSLKTKEPMSDAAFRGMIWMTYEEYGLATLEWRIKDYNNINGKRNTGSRGISKSFKIIDSPFKDAPTKTFRHSLATHLVNAVKAKGSLIDQNYVMNVLGHGDFQTTQNIYGNHVLEISEDERAARRIAVQKAMRIGKS
tara:strand:+ start:560 stop:1888 length:1329 start_codon:yes stop_codon:yes gene_type:complete